MELSDISRCAPGDPRPPDARSSRHTPGVEITTGPLGQGLRVGGRDGDGLATSAACSGGRQTGTSPFDHYIYVIASDGDIEEGVTSEASSLAAVQQLGNLIVFPDRNQISIGRHQHRAV